MKHLFNLIWPSDNLTCGFQDEVKKVKLLTDDLKCLGINYKSYKLLFGKEKIQIFALLNLNVI